MTRWLITPVLLALAMPTVAATNTALRFDTVFTTAGEPADVHFRAVYASRDGQHVVDIWRDGDRRIKRVTDGLFETYAVRAPRSPDFDLMVLDRRRKISTRIDRTNLYRLGNFANWFDLGHGLRQPKSAYTIVNGAAPANASRLVEPCRWFDLKEVNRVTHICWSRASRLPISIVGTNGVTLWRVTAIETGPIDPAMFAVSDAGFIKVDASRDVSGD